MAAWPAGFCSAHLSTGIGRALWLRARERLIERGFASAMLRVLVGNARAVRFYPHAGFSPDMGSAKRCTIGGRKLEELRYSTSL